MLIDKNSPLYLTPELYNQYLRNLENADNSSFSAHDFEYYIMYETVLRNIRKSPKLINPLKKCKKGRVSIIREDKWAYLYPQILIEISQNL